MTSDRHNIAPYPLRLQAELRARLEDAAKVGGRSLHAEILARLEQSFDVRAGTDTAAIAALAFRIAALDSDIVFLQDILNEICQVGVRVIKRLHDPQPPTQEELDEWRGAFSFFIGDWDREHFQRLSHEKEAALREAQFRLLGLTKTRQFDETHGSGLFENLARAALQSLPPASEVYQQSEEEREHERKLREVIDETPPSKKPSRKPKSNPAKKSDT